MYGGVSRDSPVLLGYSCGSGSSVLLENPNRILKVCRHLQSCQPILVTKDLVLRLKAQVLHIEAQDFSREQVLPEKDANTDRLTCYVPEAAFDDFLTQGVAVSQLYLTDSEGRSYASEVQENEFIIL